MPPPLSLAFTLPAGLAALLALPVVWWLHQRRRPGRRVTVPSLAPWLAMARQSAAPRHEAPFSLLLALRLGVALALGLALAAPWLVPAGAPPTADGLPNAAGSNEGNRQGGAGGERFLRPSGGHTVLVLDVSTSMAAAGRWAAAKQSARARLSALDGPVSLVTFGGEPLVRALQGNPAVVAADLEALQPGGAGSDATDALRLAAALAGDQGTVEIITDGALRERPSGAEAVRWDLVGPAPDDPGLDNVALVRAAARRTPSGIALFAGLASFSQKALDAPLHLVVDDRPWSDRVVRLAPGASTELQWRLPAAAQSVKIRLDAKDALAQDNQVTLPLRAWPLRVQVVGRSAAVERALAALPDIAVNLASTGTYRVDGSVDATVFIGWLPPKLPPGGVLAFHPPATGAPGTVPPGASAQPEGGTSATGEPDGGQPGTGRPSVGQPALGQPPAGETVTRLPTTEQPGANGPATLPAETEIAVELDGAGDHPWFDDLDLAGIRFEGVRPVECPGWASPVLTATNGALAYAGRRGNSRAAVFNFDPDAGNVAGHAAFPLLVGRALAWVAPDRPRPLVRAGDLVPLGPLPVAVESLDQQSAASAPPASFAEAVRIAGLPSLVRFTSAAGPAPRRWWSGVLAGDAFESDLHRPAVVSPSAATKAAATGPVPLAPWLILAAVLVVGAEGAVRGRSRAAR